MAVDAEDAAEESDEDDVDVFANGVAFARAASWLGASSALTHETFAAEEVNAATWDGWQESNSRLQVDLAAAHAETAAVRKELEAAQEATREAEAGRKRLAKSKATPARVGLELDENATANEVA